jgi:hypothetical protein
MKMKNLIGYFDCRVYKKDTKRSERVMCATDGRVNFTVAFDAAPPAEVAEFCKKSEKSGKYFLTFKVFPKSCKIYTAKAVQVDFPTFERIDGGQFEVNIDFAIKHGTGTELNGCYANAMQIIRRSDNPFEAVDGAEDFTADTKPEVGGEADNDLPF